MISFTWWCGVVLASAIAVSEVLTLAGASAHGPHTWRSRRTRMTVVGAAVLLLVLALAWRVHSVADVDAHVVEKLSLKRGAELNVLLTAVTTIGDAIPSFLIAAILALVIRRQGIHRWSCWVLPVAVLIELAIQVLMVKTFHDVTVAQARPDIPLGGIGSIPSGSVARLASLTLLTAALWPPDQVKQAARIATGGGCVVLVQIVTRLYLGRHLLADIAGGLLLGLLLAVVLGTLVQDIPGLRSRRLGAPGPGVD